MEKYEYELSRLSDGQGQDGRRTRQSSASNSSVVQSVFEKDRDRKEGVREAERGLPRDTHWYETKVEFRGIKVPIRIPMTTFDEDVGEVSVLIKRSGERWLKYSTR
jgi:hypothetical protein